MGINITVLIQIFHFFIAYALLERYFLRDAVGLIQEQDRNLAQARDTVRQATHVARQLSERVAASWRANQADLQRLVPDLERPSPTLPAREFEPVTVPRAQERHVIDALRSAFIRRVLS